MIAKRNKDFERGYERGLKDGVEKAYDLFEHNQKVIKRPKDLCNNCKLYDYEKQSCIIFGKIKQRSNGQWYPDGIRPKRCKNKIVVIK